MLDREWQDLRQAADRDPRIWDAHRQVGILYGLACLRTGEAQRAAVAALQVAVEKRRVLIEAQWDGVEVSEEGGA